ncbi:hypothetical protein WK09_32100 [Burkholderia ubonensis]|nr:hypothetical protein WK09_32100 [Burkholderia ubonensis]
MARLRVVGAISVHGIKPIVGRNLVEQFSEDIAVGTVLRVVPYWQGGEGQIAQALRKALQGAQW